MDNMFAIVADNPAAFAIGTIGMICLAIWPLFQSRSVILIVYIGNNLAFVVHYALLGHWTASAMNALMAIQTVVAIRIVEAPRLRWIYYLLMLVLAALASATWVGLPSLFAAMAASFSTLGRMQRHDIALRSLLLCAMPCWLAHDTLIGSMPGFTADILGITTGAVMLVQRIFWPNVDLAFWKRRAAPQNFRMTAEF